MEATAQWATVLGVSLFSWGVTPFLCNSSFLDESGASKNWGLISLAVCCIRAHWRTYEFLQRHDYLFNMFWKKGGNRKCHLLLYPTKKILAIRNRVFLLYYHGDTAGYHWKRNCTISMREELYNNYQNFTSSICIPRYQLQSCSDREQEKNT